MLTMADDKKEPWLNYLALTTVVLAVCATLATFKGGGFSTRSVLSQAQASDQWAYYQAKSVKSNLYEINRDQMALQAARRPRPGGRSAQGGRGLRRGRWPSTSRRRTQIQAEARRLEKIKDEAQKHSAAFGVAVIYLQIAILLSSIAALLKKKPVWWLGLVVGAVGIVQFVNGFLLFLTRPSSSPGPAGGPPGGR